MKVEVGISMNWLSATILVCFVLSGIKTLYQEEAMISARMYLNLFPYRVSECLYSK